MDFNSRLELSFYTTIATLNEEHQIYLVQHIETRKIYVKKVISVYFLSVYKQLMSLSIKGVPKIICLCEENNQLTVIEEYISGTTLSEILETKGPMCESDVLYYIKELCAILCSLHTQTPPIIHRDIKPSNIIITPDNQVYLLDFNAARYNIEKEEDTMLLGTKGYAAPEQYGFGSSNERTDIYALGMVINTMLWGKFSREMFVNSSFTPIITKCTDLNPNGRYKSAYVLLNELIKLRISNSTGQAKEKVSKLLPGFRSRKVSHMLLATPVYLFLLWMCLTLEVESSPLPVLWFERIMCLLIFFSVIACFTNYLNIQRFMPLCRNRNKIINSNFPHQ